MKPRKTLMDMAGNGDPVQIAGRPADVCPVCGCALFANGTNATDTNIVRYVVCRNRSCGKRFLSSQPPAKLLREVGGDEDSSSGKPTLTLVRKIG